MTYAVTNVGIVHIMLLSLSIYAFTGCGIVLLLSIEIYAVTYV